MSSYKQFQIRGTAAEKVVPQTTNIQCPRIHGSDESINLSFDSAAL